MRSGTRRVVCSALALIVAACRDASGASDASDAPGPAGEFVGRVAGTDALIALVTDGTAVRVYACDGTPARQLTIGEWFKGDAVRGSVDLVSLSGVARVVARVTATEVTGTLQLATGPALSFNAAPVTAPAGFWLYKAIHNGELQWAGWIVASDGSVRGSSPTPVRTSVGVTLNVAAGTAQLPSVGAVTPARLTSGLAPRGFQGCFPGQIC